MYLPFKTIGIWHNWMAKDLNNVCIIAVGLTSSVANCSLQPSSLPLQPCLRFLHLTGLNFHKRCCGTWCNPLTLQPGQSGGQILIPGRAPPLERHGMGSRTRSTLPYFCNIWSQQRNFILPSPSWLNCPRCDFFTTLLATASIKALFLQRVPD